VWWKEWWCSHSSGRSWMAMVAVVCASRTGTGTYRVERGCCVMLSF
jgi:hypothetical protein